MTYSIGEASDLTGVPVETLRYYESADMFTNIARDGAGRRRFSQDDIAWIAFVRRLRSTGMPVRDVASYTAAVRRGDGTLADRRRLLQAHRDRVRHAIDELTDALDVLDRKIADYKTAELGVDDDRPDTILRSVRFE